MRKFDQWERFFIHSKKRNFIPQQNTFMVRRKLTDIIEVVIVI